VTTRCTKSGCKPNVGRRMPGAGLSRGQSGKHRLESQPSSRTGGNPPYGMIGRIEETSASFEARSAPRSYPTTVGSLGHGAHNSRCPLVLQEQTFASVIGPAAFAQLPQYPERQSCDDPPVAWTVTLRPQLNKNRARARETLKKPLWLPDLNGSIDSLGDGPCIGIVVRAQFPPLLSLF
jgi:hypothetical protein